MRILLVSHRFPPDGIVGVERITQSLAYELVKTGHYVSVVTRQPGLATVPQLIRERLPNGAALYRLTGGSIRLERFLDQHERLEQAFAAALLEERPDVVHVLHLLGLSPRFVEIAHRHGAAVVVSLQDFFFACPTVLLRQTSGKLCRGPDGGRECARTCYAGEGAKAEVRWGLRHVYYRRILVQAERVVCPSRYVLDYFTRFGVDPTRIRLVPNGVSLEPADQAIEVRSTPRDRGALNLAFLGSVVLHKGVHVILEALALAGLERVHLAVFGPVAEPRYVRELRERAAAILGLTLRLYGAYEPTSLPCLLSDVDCIVAPSQWPETFAIVVREAFVRGIPVAVSNLGGLPEAVSEGENGFTFDPARPGELAAILRRLADDEGLLGRLRRGAQRSLVLSLAAHTSAVRQVYQEATEDFAHGGAARGGDAEELAFLHSALLTQGFGGSRPPAPPWMTSLASLGQERLGRTDKD